MSFDNESPMTLLLHAVHRNEPGAREKLWAKVYAEMHRLARLAMANEANGRTLQTTALVHEAFFRLGGCDDLPFNHRGHFFAAAAEAMRRILVDDARRRKRLKRGGAAAHEPLNDQTPASGNACVDLLDLDEALAALEATDAHLASVVKMRFFTGLTVDDTAEALGVSARKIDKDWRLARAWLHRKMGGD
ncbi:MAG TPA: ECF-type sigma factor [Phycisphaerae bacterium]|nr:ECF-type sigma factor [Phycisphaerae bacterium]